MNIVSELVLFTPYFKAQTIERQMELDYCLRKNLECNAIDRIVLLVDDGHRPPIMDERIRIIDIEGRPSYRLWAKLSEAHAKGAITVLANTDIYFDESICELRRTLDEPNRLVALTRLDKVGDHLVPHPNPRWSQDTWAYCAQAPLPPSLLAALDIPLGVPRCDNKVAYVFAIHGWRVCNPCEYVRSVHVHETNQRAYNKKTDLTVLGGVAYVPPSLGTAASSKIEIDIWARGTDAIQSVTLNRSLDQWMDEQVAPKAEQSLLLPQGCSPAAPKLEQGKQVRVDIAVTTQVPLSSDYPKSDLGANQVLSLGRVAWADNLMRFRLLEHRGQWYAHDTLQSTRSRPLTDTRLVSDGTPPAEVILATFLPPVLDTAPIIVRDRPTNKDDCHFWQYPAATERQAWQNHMAIAQGANQVPKSRTVHTYLGLPWATYIDKKRLPEEVTRLFVPRLRGLHRLAQHLGWSLRVHTVCQQIYWRRLIETFHQLGVTDLHLSHATNDIDPECDGWKLRIHSWPLYAPNIEVPERRVGLTIGKPIEEKRYLASFIGAHMPHYRSDVRVRLFEAAKASRRHDILVDLGNEWHFNKVVYEEQVQHKPLAEDEAAAIAQATRRYNEVLSDSVFSLCPEGAGPNTLRLWESLAVGAIPVVMAKQWAPPTSNVSVPGLEGCALLVNDPPDVALFKHLESLPRGVCIEMQQAAIALYAQLRSRTTF